MEHAAGALLAWLFVTPLDLPDKARLFMFFPLAAAIAVVYRATRAKRVEDLPRATVITFLNICLGMFAIAISAYLLHRLMMWMTP